jgi:hypothetical protein
MVSIFGGASIPLGDFSDPNIGAANRGFTVGAQLVTDKGFLFNGSYSSHPTNLKEMIESKGGSGTFGRWNSFLFLAGLNIEPSRESRPAFFFAPLFGVMFTSSPNVEYSITETFPSLVLIENYSTASVSSSGIAYGAMVGLDTKHVTLGARYIASNLNFHYLTTYTENTGTKSVTETSSQQNLAVLQIIVGVKF